MNQKFKECKKIIQRKYNLENDYIIFRELLANNLDLIIETDENRQTLLHIAVIAKEKKMVEILLEAGADITAKDNCDKTPFDLNAEKLDKEIFNLLIKKLLYIRNSPNLNPLHKASYEGNIAEVKRLVAGKSTKDLNIKDKFGFTPLHEAVDKGHIEIAKILIQNGADVNPRNILGETPLYYAASKKNEEIVKILCDAGADVNLPNIFGDTPLHTATMYGLKNNIIEILRKTEINLNFQNKKNNTSLHLAAYDGRKDIVEILIQAGAELNYANFYGNTPLHLAILQKHTEIVKFLVNKDNKIIHILNNNLDTPLHSAAYREHHQSSIDIAKFLIETGADLNLKNKQGYTPLHIAVNNNNKELVELLLKHGANPHIKNNNMKFPLYYATKNKNNDIIASLNSVKKGVFSKIKLFLSSFIKKILSPFGEIFHIFKLKKKPFPSQHNRNISSFRTEESKIIDNSPNTSLSR